MKNVFLAIGLIILLNSCQKKEVNFSESMLEKLNMENDKIPSRFSAVNLYVSCNNNEVVQLNSYDLFRIYQNEYLKDFNTFKFFLNAVLNDGFSIDKKVFVRGSYLHYKVKLNNINLYLENGFDAFLGKYSKKSNKRISELELNKSAIKEHEYLTIVYVFYMKGYDVSQDCMLGVDYLRLRKHTFE